MSEKTKYLRIIIEVLNDSIKYPDQYEMSNNMKTVCCHLSSYCKLVGKGNYTKTFKAFGELFAKQYAQTKRRLCRIEVLIDKGEDGFRKNPEIEGSQYVLAVPAKGKKLSFTKRLDGTTIIEFWNAKIEVPTRIIREYYEEEVKP